jgi:probable phosphoglycerate mutase
VPAVPPARLLIIRHGQSTWNAAHRWQGTADPPLSPLGEAQAREAAHALGERALGEHALGEHGLDQIVTSPLRRAQRTARLIAETLGLGEPQVVADLAERDVGEWTGLTRREIETRWPGALDAPPHDPPGGETRQGFGERIDRVLDHLLDAHAGLTTAVVAHGGVIRAVEVACGVGPGPIPNLVAWWVTGHPGAPDPGPRWQLVEPDTRNAAMPTAP